MIKAGLCSVCFKQNTPEEVIDLALRANLAGIEWIGNTHVPAGDVETARKVGEMTRVAGLSVAAYGSVFRLGTDSDFSPHLDSAVALGASSLRIFAGSGKPSCDLTSEERLAFVSEAKRISEMAAERGISVSTECHDQSLTDCVESQLRFMEEVDMPNFRTYWQMLFSLSDDEQIKSLRSVRESGKLTNIHIYQYKITEEAREKRPLSEGFPLWSELFSLFKNDETERFAMLEFVGGYPEESFFEDSKTLLKLADIANTRK